MRSFFRYLFIDNWPRKILSLILAVIIWFVVNQSLTVTKTISGVSVHVINIPPGKTVEGIQPNGLLSKKITLTITGNKSLMEELNANDFEVVIDASNKSSEFMADITKKNLQPLNSEINLSQSISKIGRKTEMIKITKLVTDKIPVIIGKPIGEAPKGYQFVDIWPYQLFVTVSGPEDVVKKLKTKGTKLSFNLNDISKSDLDDLAAKETIKGKEAVSFFVPSTWKEVQLPGLSRYPVEINDPRAKYLRIDFIRSEIHSIKTPIPVNLFIPPNYNGSTPPQKLNIATNGLVSTKGGLKVITTPLYAKGVSELFLDIMRDRMEILIIIPPQPETGKVYWSVEFVNQRLLEDRYVKTIMSDVGDGKDDLQPKVREEFLRNRFRNYMNRFQLYKSKDEPFDIKVSIQNSNVNIEETSTHENP